MKLLRLGEPGHERPAVLHGDRVVDVSALFPDYELDIEGLGSQRQTFVPA